MQFFHDELLAETEGCCLDYMLPNFSALQMLDMGSSLYLVEYSGSKYADIVSLQLLQLFWSQDSSKISYLGSVLV